MSDQQASGTCEVEPATTGMVLFDRRSPLRTIVLNLVFAALTVASVGPFFLAEWATTSGQKTLIAVIGLVFTSAAVQGIQERVCVTRHAFAQRWLGVWVRRQLPSRVGFEPKPDGRNPYGGLARRILAAPTSISIKDSATGREVAVIGFDMLAGMTSQEYRRLLRRLNEAAQQADAADEAQGGTRSPS